MTCKNEISKIVSQLKDKYACGDDGTMPRNLKLQLPVILGTLEVVINKILEEGVFSKVLKVVHQYI